MILLQTCRISPPPATVAEQSVPLTFSDLIWLPFQPIRRLLFYDLSCSKPHFLETLLPKLKQSLSITLKHFFPLAGNIVYPQNSDIKPVIHYRPGDSVSVAIFESSDDFDDLVGDHPRDADKFYDFIPQLSPVVEEQDHKLLQVFALQVTLFPGRGVCIGFANHHSVGDAGSIARFINSWASINRHGGETEPLPLLDRSLVKYPPHLDSIYLNYAKRIPMSSPSFPLPTNRVRATYVFRPSEIKKLKGLVRAKIPGLVHVSSFVVMSAYVWTCLVKSLKASEEDELEHFLFPVDFRARIDPPVPGNYFGNCLSFGLPNIRRQELVGDEGFILAAQVIAEEVQNRVVKKNQILEGAEARLIELGPVVRKPFFSVSGSARVDFYGADFGWGKARKLEMLLIDGEKYSISLCKSKDFEGGLEVGLSLPKDNMEAFAANFCDGLNE